MLGKTDWKRLAVLLDQLHLCTGIKFALMDERGGELCTSNDGAPFCSAVLAHPCGAQCCHDCDRRAVETALATCRPQKYICHAGLYEVVYPVMEDTNVTAVILFGQILNDQTREAQWERVRQRCGWHPDQQALHSAFLKLRRVSDEQINACIEIVRPCVSEVRLHGLYDINTWDDALRLRMYLDAHYAEPIDLGVLTKVLHVEKTKLCQSVKKRCGLTPMQLVTRLRLSKAQELLSTTGESVKTIAAAVGFQDANYFIKVFHKETGCTPVQFRQRGDRNMEEYQ